MKLFLVIFCVIASLTSQAQQRPNIVIIMADDMGYGDLGCYGAQKISTPSIDSLARQGMRFTDAHTASSLCSPSRYSLMTGRYSWRTHLRAGVLTWFAKPLIEQNRTTIASLLKKNGYKTACIGKWHLGFDWALQPGAPANADSMIFDSWDVNTQDYIDFSKPVKGGPIERGFDYYYVTIILSLPAANAQQPGKKMNVIFFLVDDLGWNDVQCNNPNSFYETPNINAFAQQGTRFTNAYAACHVCSPTRASIMTGKYPARLQLTDWLPGRKNYPFQKLTNAETRQYLPFEEKTIAETFKENGYRTAIFGKWHLGEDSSSPLQHGFDYRQLMSGLDAMNNKASNVLTGRGLIRRDVTIMPEVFRDNGYHTGIFGKWHLGDVYPDRPMDRGFEKSIWTKGWGLLSETEFDNDYYHTRYQDSLELKYSNKYCSDLWFDEAMKWMDGLVGQSEPFFTYIPLNAPHGPFYAPEDEAAYYRKIVGDSVIGSFLGMVSNIDKNMARLDEWLVKRHLKENTLVIFMNDNGGTGGVKLYNAGMRGEKTSVYDGGHRAACFVSWPGGRLGPPRSIDYASNIQDLLPTFIDLFGFKLKKKQSFDGISLKKVWQQPGRHFDNRMFVVQYTGKEKPEKYFSSVVWDNWRLVNGNELYDISKDPGQQNEIAVAQPAVTARLKAHYEKWWKKLEPVVFDYVPVMIGSKKENPVLLSSNGWIGAGGINTQWGVAMANGDVHGGTWQKLAYAAGLIEQSAAKFIFSRRPVKFLHALLELIGVPALRQNHRPATAIDVPQPETHDEQ
ncbi:arylsulfatase [Ostertagia ostertagi]